MARPDMTDPQQLAAYRRELHAVGRPWRWAGLALVVAGAGVMLARGKGFDPLSIALLAIGWAILIAVIVTRTRYHRQRMAED